jgi:hypothetical protein
MASSQLELPPARKAAGLPARKSEGTLGPASGLARETGDQGPAAAVETGRPILSWLYSYSLGIALALLFIISFALHRSASLANSDTGA